MHKPLPLLLLTIALAACSGDAPTPPAAPSTTESAVPGDREVRVRLGIIFADSAPWMAGGIIDQGRIRIGDRLFLRTQDGRSVSVQITAIRDDATQVDVPEATAPQGVFLSFRPDASTPIDDAGSDAMLLGDPAAKTASPNAR